MSIIKTLLILFSVYTLIKILLFLLCFKLSLKFRCFIFRVLDLIPYRTPFGLSISDVLKVLYYQKVSKKICLCGGHIYTRGIPPDGWETSCTICEFLFDED